MSSVYIPIGQQQSTELRECLHNLINDRQWQKSKENHRFESQIDVFLWKMDQNEQIADL